MHSRLGSRTVRPRQRRSRATALLEFVLLLPMFMFLMLFIFDVSRVLMVSGVAQDAAYRAARAGAVYGGADPDGSRPALAAFNQATRELPGGGSLQNARVEIVRGSECISTAGEYVEIRVHYDIDMVTPGLGRLLNGINGLPADGAYHLSSTAIARCEVARR